MSRWPLLSLVFFLACTPKPGSTPVEQEPLLRLDAPLQAPPLVTCEEAGLAAGPLLDVFREFHRTRIVLHVVWQTNTPPSTAMLAKFPGKHIRQYWDPRKLTESSRGQLRAGNGYVPLEAIALRVAFARIAALQN